MGRTRGLPLSPSLVLRRAGPEEETGQPVGGAAAGGGVGQREGLGCGLLAGQVLGQGQEVGWLGGEGGGGGAGGPTGGQRGVADGDGWWEGADLLVGGLLRDALVLTHLLHRHVCRAQQRHTVTLWS